MALCVISQPRFFPGLHYIHRMILADIFVILDTVQYNPRHEENRTRIKSKDGSQWLTVPMYRNNRCQTINQTYINNEIPWQKKAIGKLQSSYGKSRFFKKYSKIIFDILSNPYQKLTELDIASWEPALKALDIRPNFIYASELGVSGKGAKLLLDICNYLDVDTYLSGAFGREYLNIEMFRLEGVSVYFHEYEYPVYHQRFGDFIPYLSYLDMLLNVEMDLNKIKAGGKVRIS